MKNNKSCNIKKIILFLIAGVLIVLISITTAQYKEKHVLDKYTEQILANSNYANTDNPCLHPDIICEGERNV